MTDAHEFDRPLIILGPTRSGKTLLARALDQLPGWVHLYESITIWDLGSSRRPDARRDASEATAAVKQQIRNQLQHAAHGQRFVEDLPHLVFRIPFVHRVLPEARFLFVTRDPLTTLPAMKHGWVTKDTVSLVLQRRVARQRYRSLKLSRLLPHLWKWGVNYVRTALGRHKQVWGPTVPGQHEFARSHELIEVIAYQWAQMAQHCLDGLEQLPPERVLHLRFENLFEHQQATLQQVAHFAEVDPDALLTAFRRLIIPEKIPGVTVPVDAREWQLALPIIRPLQHRLGYKK